MIAIKLQTIVAAVHDAQKDPVYTAVGLLRHRTKEREHECAMAIRRAIDQRLVEWTWHGRQLPVLTREGENWLSRVLP